MTPHSPGMDRETILRMTEHIETPGNLPELLPLAIRGHSKEFWRGVSQATLMLISYGSSPERIAHLHSHANKKLVDIEREKG